jgi:phosphonate transport system substrate-binding protein
MNKALLFLLLLVVGAAACKNKQALDVNGVPSTLIVGVYQGDNPALVTPVLAQVRGYLTKKLGMKVEFQTSTEYTSVIEAIASKKVHVAYLSPFSYILATQKTKLIPLVVLGEKGSPSIYRSLIITNPHTGLKTMEDVKSRAKSLTLCFADPASTSGHLVPRAYLTSIGLNPETSFKETMFAGSHAASALSVKSGKTDIGCAYEFALGMLERTGTMAKDDIVILWTSDPIVEGPVTIRPDINRELIERIRTAFLQMPVEAPDVWQAYVSIYRKDISGLCYVPATDSMYESLRKIAGGINDVDGGRK